MSARGLAGCLAATALLLGGCGGSGQDLEATTASTASPPVEVPPGEGVPDEALEPATVGDSVAFGDGSVSGTVTLHGVEWWTETPDTFGPVSGWWLTADVEVRVEQGTVNVAIWDWSASDAAGVVHQPKARTEPYFPTGLDLTPGRTVRAALSFDGPPTDTYLDFAPDPLTFLGTVATFAIAAPPGG